MHPLFILLALVAVIFAVRWVKEQPPEKRQQAGFTAALLGAAALLLVALATGRLNPLVAAVAAAIPMMQRLSHAKSVVDRLRGTFRASADADPTLSTEHLRVVVDPDTGQWTGVILSGQHKGASLSSLGFEELVALHSRFQHAAPESAALLSSYLQRHYRQQWQASEQHDSRVTRPATSLSEREARQILGVDDDASQEAIIAAHRRLMQKLHPDRGGSDYLASKLNEAKDRLLRTT